jgi:hypothetical protein
MSKVHFFYENLAVIVAIPVSPCKLGETLGLSDLTQPPRLGLFCALSGL